MYKTYEKKLDIISYSIIFTTLIISSVVGGRINFLFFRGVPTETNQMISVFSSIFILSILVFYFFSRVNEWLVSKGSTKTTRAFRVLLLGSVIYSLIFIVFTYLLFSTSGGWIISGRPGISGGLGSFWLDFVVYFIVALVLSGLLSVKSKIHKYFNTSIFLFIISLFIYTYFIGGFKIVSDILGFRISFLIIEGIFLLLILTMFNKKEIDNFVASNVTFAKISPFLLKVIKLSCVFLLMVFLGVILLGLAGPGSDVGAIYR